MPKRIQRRRTKDWRKPEGVVNVTRPGKWGNPFPVKKWGDQAIPLFKAYIEKVVEWDIFDLEDLRGKDLMCWCKVGSPCHGDILLEMANK